MFDVASSLPATDRAVENHDADTYDTVGVKTDVLPSIGTLFNTNNQGTRFENYIFWIDVDELDLMQHRKLINIKG